MRIVLAERHGEMVIGERVFDDAVIRIGRDPARCLIVYAYERWPTVSRTHAEVRREQGRWVLIDLNSTHGTFLDGRRIDAPEELKLGARIQLGAGGPILSVERVEAGAAAPPPAFDEQPAPKKNTQAPADAYQDSPTDTPPFVAQQPEPSQQKTAPRAQVPAQAPPAPPSTGLRTKVMSPTDGEPSAKVSEQKPAPADSQKKVSGPQPSTSGGTFRAMPSLIFERGATASLQKHVGLRSAVNVLGRDPSCDIVIESSAAIVSRRHAEIRAEGEGHVLVDLNSFNGTLLNGLRITQPSPLADGDMIQLGMNGPLLRFIDPAHQAAQRPATGAIAPKATPEAAGPLEQPQPSSPLPPPVQDDLDQIVPGHGTIMIRGRVRPAPVQPGAVSSERLLTRKTFDNRGQLTVGRDADNDIRLDGLQISTRHARFINTGSGIFVEDAGSTNGVYVGGLRISGRRAVGPEDVVQVGPFILRVDAGHGVSVFDSRSKMRIDAIDVTQVVAGPSGRGTIRILDDVDVAIQPNEFVGLLGPSGAGKSTLLGALNGMRLPTEGRVLVNSLELYQHLDSLKQQIGFVPQDDIIHRELTVYRTLYYVARLRLPRDVARAEVEQIISEVLDVTGLSERRDVLVSRLSGGQRKRVSIAVELITQPSVIFLDEPTSGLDPAAEEKIMQLFRQIAESGRTVVLTTHAMENVRLFDKVLLLMRGRLVFYGPPEEALEFTGAKSFKELYDRLEAPIGEEAARLAASSGGTLPEGARHEIAERVAEQWRQRFRQTEVFRRHVAEPLSGLDRGQQAAPPPPRRRLSPADALRQWVTLARRYSDVLRHDRTNLLILFAQAPVIALLTWLVTPATAARDFPFFVLAIVAVWFGTSVAAREIVKERAVYARERMVNLRLLPYVGSKFLVLSFVVGLQCLLLFGTVKALDVAGLLPLPGILFGLPQLFVLMLTGTVGVALGLFVSALVRTSEMATSLVPLILIPQILFSGLVGVPQGAARVAGAMMPATWAFDAMKRYSALDTLREEGSDPQGKDRGLGLYKRVERANDENVSKARANVEEYRRKVEADMKDYEQRMREYLASPARAASQPPAVPDVGEPPRVPEAQKIPEDLSGYVSFKHPWGSEWINPAVLLVMLFFFLNAAVIALRSQDVQPRRR